MKRCREETDVTFTTLPHELWREILVHILKTLGEADAPVEPIHLFTCCRALRVFYDEAFSDVMLVGYYAQRLECALAREQRASWLAMRDRALDAHLAARQYRIAASHWPELRLLYLLREGHSPRQVLVHRASRRPDFRDQELGDLLWCGAWLLEPGNEINAASLSNKPKDSPGWLTSQSWRDFTRTIRVTMSTLYAFFDGGYTHAPVDSIISGDAIVFTNERDLCTYLVARHFYATRRGITLVGDLAHLVSQMLRAAEHNWPRCAEEHTTVWVDMVQRGVGTETLRAFLSVPGRFGPAPVSTRVDAVVAFAIDQRLFFSIWGQQQQMHRMLSLLSK